MRCLHGLTGSLVDHTPITPGFKSQLGYFRRMFHCSLSFTIFGDCSAHLAYHVHKVAVKQLHFTITEYQSLAEHILFFWNYFFFILKYPKDSHIRTATVKFTASHSTIKVKQK